MHVKDTLNPLWKMEVWKTKSGRRDYCENRRHQNRKGKHRRRRQRLLLCYNEYYDNVLIKPNNTLFPIKPNRGFRQWSKDIILKRRLKSGLTLMYAVFFTQYYYALTVALYPVDKESKFSYLPNNTTSRSTRYQSSFK
jgi:hypothetical protein